MDPTAIIRAEAQRFADVAAGVVVEFVATDVDRRWLVEVGRSTEGSRAVGMDAWWRGGNFG
jgi:hypothetical protein